ncbi:hypothetical protein SADUNF_Sadunf06G0173300 [Salix dunnii]|uniref:Uncharacterized protein n=1 Tax=Salix dunnii TaxID=1413687 RepID=A0A835K561_9ROSI|nr:hypothetical protein SADUNF_Sadunf06G0173300 [Salix dunnii]
MLSIITQNMGSFCSKQRRYNEADAEENAQAAEIERRIEQETKAEKHIQKLLLLGLDSTSTIGAGDSGKSTIFKQIKLLFQSGFDEAELKSYIPVIHANVYQTIKILHDGSKELAQNETESLKYVISNENKDIGKKLSEIGGFLDHPPLTKELAQEIETLWRDAAVQLLMSMYTCRKLMPVVISSKFQIVPLISWIICKDYLTQIIFQLRCPVQWFYLGHSSAPVNNDVLHKNVRDDVLYARVRTTGVVEIQFSPVGENKKSGEVYRLFDVGGQRNERRKWIHLFEGVTAVIFCAAISEYDQTLFEDENKNRMIETKELFEWVLKQPCFEKTSFMLFLNKFDIFEKKVLKVRAAELCILIYQFQQENKRLSMHTSEHLFLAGYFVLLDSDVSLHDLDELIQANACIFVRYMFVKKKFEELYFQSTTPDHVDRVFKIYRTTALDQKLVKKTFKLVDETLRRRNLFEAGLL